MIHILSRWGLMSNTQFRTKSASPPQTLSAGRRLPPACASTKSAIPPNWSSRSTPTYGAIPRALHSAIEPCRKIVKAESRLTDGVALAVNARFDTRSQDEFLRGQKLAFRFDPGAVRPPSPTQAAASTSNQHGANPWKPDAIPVALRPDAAVVAHAASCMA